jgi:hypothetical protein
MRYLLLFGVFLAGLGAFWVLGGEALVEKVTEARVEQALLDNGVPANMSACMAPRLVDRLSIEQLRKLERFAPEKGENRIPLSTGEAMTRLRRVDDRQAVEEVVIVAGGCGIDIGLELLRR